MDALLVSLNELDLTQPIALVYCNKHSCVSERAHSPASGKLFILMMGVVQSLTISVACAVSLYEAMCQHHPTVYAIPQCSEACSRRRIR